MPELNDARTTIELTRLILKASPNKLDVVFGDTDPNAVLDKDVKDIERDIETAYHRLVPKVPRYGQFVRFTEPVDDEVTKVHDGIYLGISEHNQAMVMLPTRVAYVSPNELRILDRIICAADMDPKENWIGVHDTGTKLSIVDKYKALMNLK